MNVLSYPNTYNYLPFCNTATYLMYFQPVVFNESRVRPNADKIFPQILPSPQGKTPQETKPNENKTHSRANPPENKNTLEQNP